MRMRRTTQLLVPAAALALLAGSNASANSVGSAADPSRVPEFRLIDIGTLGGANSELDGTAIQITKGGAVLGAADTTVADSDFPEGNPFLGPDPQIKHAFSWESGHLTDLGALPGNNSSAVFEVNAPGLGAGVSETGAIDPRTGYPVAHAVMFRQGTVRDLGTLPEGSESMAVAINDHGDVAGFANNGVEDPFSIFGWGTQTRGFIVRDGVMRDLGTLGGPDSVVATLNAHGQVAGDSYVNDNPNPESGVPTTHSFLWTRGHMRDLGSLGGTTTATSWLNDSGAVVGQGSLAGDQTVHPFLWNGRHLSDLGTLGGDFGTARYINDRGSVVGFSTPPGNQTVHAFLWKHGTMADLTGNASLDCTVAEAVNERDQVVGETCGADTALFWDGGVQYDLNALVGPSDVHLFEAPYISNRGEITALGELPDGSHHAFLLRPMSR